MCGMICTWLGWYYNHSRVYYIIWWVKQNCEWKVFDLMLKMDFYEFWCGLLAIVVHPIQSTSTSMAELRISESCNVNGIDVITWRFVMYSYWHLRLWYVLSLIFIWVVVGAKWWLQTKGRPRALLLVRRRTRLNQRVWVPLDQVILHLLNPMIKKGFSLGMLKPNFIAIWIKTCA